MKEKPVKREFPLLVAMLIAFCTVAALGMGWYLYTNEFPFWGGDVVALPMPLPGNQEVTIKTPCLAALPGNTHEVVIRFTGNHYDRDLPDQSTTSVVVKGQPEYQFIKLGDKIWYKNCAVLSMGEIREFQLRFRLASKGMYHR